MKTQSIIRRATTASTLGLLLFAVACQKNASMEKNTIVPPGKSVVNVYLTDDPSLVFDKVLLDIRKLEIKVEDSTEMKHESEHQNDVDDNDHHGDTAGGWMVVPINAGIYDILQFRNGLDTLFANGSFPSTHGLKKVRVTLGTNNSVVFNGTPFPLTIKGNDNIIMIKIDEAAVQLNSGGVTNFWIDIDAGRSIRKHGSDFELKPSVKIFSKEKSGGLEGRVLPKDANAVVMAINGTDTATAKPESEGEFKINGLKAGTYSLVFHATANNYLDTTINNIVIKTKEDIKIPVVTLHK